MRFHNLDFKKTQKMAPRLMQRVTLFKTEYPIDDNHQVSDPPQFLLLK